jgi:hypothetical protein
MSVSANPLPKHSGRVPSEGLLLLLGLTLIGPLVIGWLYHFTAQWFDLIVVSSMIVGGVAGGILSAGVKKARCRNPKLMGLLGAIAGLLAMTIRYGFDAQEFYGQLPQELVDQTRADNDPLSLAEAQQVVHDNLKRIGPLRAFTTFMEMRAEAGVTLQSSHSYRKDSGTPISGGGFWVLLGAETLLALGIAAAVASGGVNMPYCERCNRWYEVESVMAAPFELAEQVTAAARAHNWSALMALRQPIIRQGNDLAYVTVVLKRCGSCDDGVVEGSTTVKKKDQSTTKPLFAEAINASDVLTLRNSRQTPV